MVFLLFWESENKWSKRDLFFNVFLHHHHRKNKNHKKKLPFFLHRNLMKDFSTTGVIIFLLPNPWVFSLKIA